MTTTNPIPPEAWTSYFDAFSKRFLRDDVPELATVDVRGRWTGERRAVTGARVHGITYDHHDRVLDVALAGADHLIHHPVAIWVREADDGFIEQMTVLRDDGVREVVTLARPARDAMVA